MLSLLKKMRYNGLMGVVDLCRGGVS
jgi:hypothetical protein